VVRVLNAREVLRVRTLRLSCRLHDPLRWGILLIGMIHGLGRAWRRKVWRIRLLGQCIRRIGVRMRTGLLRHLGIRFRVHRGLVLKHNLNYQHKGLHFHRHRDRIRLIWGRQISIHSGRKRFLWKPRLYWILLHHHFNSQPRLDSRFLLH
jgi:hypothetical protein